MGGAARDRASTRRESASRSTSRTTRWSTSTSRASSPGRSTAAGDVIVWDWGRWTPDKSIDDPEAAVRAGELKFRLDGEKLRGEFVLVRTGRRQPGAKEQWLLIHRRDGEIVRGWDAEDHLASVKTGRTNDQVAAGRRA